MVRIVVSFLNEYRSDFGIVYEMREIRREESFELWREWVSIYRRNIR